MNESPPFHLRVPPREADGRPAISPSLERVRELAARYGQVALSHTYIADCETPVSAFLKLRDGGPAFLLESVERGNLGRHSMIGVRPQAVIRGAGGRLVQRDAAGNERDLDASDPFGAVEDAVRAVRMAPSDEPLAFTGGAVGYYGYDLVRTVERLPDVPDDDLGVPDLVQLISGPVVLFDHLRRTLTLVVPCPVAADRDPVEAYAQATERIVELKRRLTGPVPSPDPSSTPRIGEVRPNMPREAYESAVRQAQEYVFAGDAFQVVPSQRFSVATNLDPFSIYRALRTVNPSPYMFFFECDDLTLVGSSPELLVKAEGDHVQTHPIAGSRPRGTDEEDDQRLADELLGDPKERAEHVMLVDLGRNDLGRVSRTGTVRVSELMDVRRYSHIMHIESTVEGHLRPELRASDALRATFPAGTLSGAPKVRAMEIIDELEPTKRGPYGGALGWIGWDGDMDTCITIRTLVCTDGRVHVQAGAGVVADSQPATEYHESRNKAAALLRAIEVAAGEETW
ncbi:MAG TPA: anthranilate synthase component I [Miltoncostaeaceae bacterium]|nr:anthranilate synthase component I [Miltoncostaeaceae bacterium]